MITAATPLRAGTRVSYRRGHKEYREGLVIDSTEVRAYVHWSDRARSWVKRGNLELVPVLKDGDRVVVTDGHFAGTEGAVLTVEPRPLPLPWRALVRLDNEVGPAPKWLHCHDLRKTDPTT